MYADSTSWERALIPRCSRASMVSISNPAGFPRTRIPTTSRMETRTPPKSPRIHAGINKTKTSRSDRMNSKQMMLMTTSAIDLSSICYPWLSLRAVTTFAQNAGLAIWNRLPGERVALGSRVAFRSFFVVRPSQLHGPEQSAKKRATETVTLRKTTVFNWNKIIGMPEKTAQLLLLFRPVKYTIVYYTDSVPGL